MTVKAFIPLCSISLLGLWSPTALLAQATADRPNILFIFADDHAAHALSAYGSRINRTPNLDRLAEGGMLFRNYFCTNSLCGPVRAVIQTGKYAHKNGFYRNGQTFDGSQQTFPKLLQKAGYQTAVIGKWHLESAPRGFDFSEILIGQGPYYNPPMIRNGSRAQHTGYTTDIITDLALNWLKTGRDQTRPFMLMYQHKAPHRNWQPGPKYLTLYDGIDIPEPPDLFDNWAGRGTAAKTQEMTIDHHLNPEDLKLVAPRNLTAEQLEAWNRVYEPKNEAFRQANPRGEDLWKWKYQRFIKDYLRCVASLDENVGRVLDYLDESGLARNTVVIYTSDQGFFLGDHNWFDKRFMYEESLRSPLLVRWPDHIKPGSISDAMVLDIDMAPLFLDLAGVTVPPDMQGRSFRPILLGETPSDWRQSMYYHYYEFPAVHSVRRHYGVRTQRYKLMYFYNLDEWELYDLVEDPREMNNKYDDATSRDVVAELKAELGRLRQVYEVGPDPFPVPSTPPAVLNRNN